MDKCERLMNVLRSACAKERIVRSYHVIYAQEVVADLAAANARIATLEAQLAEKEAENERWQRNMRDAYEAFSAMRNDLNELFPIQSAEADLADGPEWSVSCAAIVKAAAEALSRTGAVKAAWLVGRRSYAPAFVLEDEDRTEREWEKAKAELSALEPAAPVDSDGTLCQLDDPAQVAEELGLPAASEVEPVAWQYRIRVPGDPVWSDWMDGQRHYKTIDLEYEERPLYTRPSEQAVTEAMVEAAYSLSTCVSPEEMRAALKAAMEAGR